MAYTYDPEVNEIYIQEDTRGKERLNLTSELQISTHLILVQKEEEKERGGRGRLCRCYPHIFPFVFISAHNTIAVQGNYAHVLIFRKTTYKGDMRTAHASVSTHKLATHCVRTFHWTREDIRKQYSFLGYGPILIEIRDCSNVGS
jgi:hypothetical protein